MKVECSRCKKSISYNEEVKSGKSLTGKYFCLLQGKRVGVKFKSHSPEGIVFICEDCITNPTTTSDSTSE